MCIMDFCRKNRGSISIFLLIVLLPMVTYATMIIDASRLQSAKSEISGAGDLAMSSAMADYEATLHELYGLFAMSPDEETLKKNVQGYFEKNIRNSLGDDANTNYVKEAAEKITNMAFNSEKIDINTYDFDNLINMNPENVQASYVQSSALSNPYVLKKQIVEFMKYRGPISCANNILSKVMAFKDSSNQTAVVEKKVNYTTKLGTIENPCINTYTHISEYFDLCNEFEAIRESLNKRYEQAERLCIAATIIKQGDSNLNKDSITFEQINNIQYNSESEEEILTDIENKLDENKRKLEEFGEFIDNGNGNFSFTFNEGKLNLNMVNSWNSYLGEIGDNVKGLKNYFTNPVNDVGKECILSISQNIKDYNQHKEYFYEKKDDIIELNNIIGTYEKLLSDYYNHIQNFCNQSEDEKKKAQLNERWRDECSRNSALVDGDNANVKGNLNEIFNLYNNTDPYINYANDCITEASKLIGDYLQKISNLEVAISYYINNDLDDVLAKLTDIETAKNDWGESVNAVKDQSLKSNFKSDFDAEGEKFDRSQITALKDIFGGVLKKLSNYEEKISNNAKYLNNKFPNKDTQYLSFITKDTVPETCFTYSEITIESIRGEKDKIESNPFYLQIKKMAENSKEEKGLDEDQKKETGSLNNLGNNNNRTGLDAGENKAKRGSVSYSGTIPEEVRNDDDTGENPDLKNTEISASEKEDQGEARKEYEGQGESATSSLSNVQGFLSKIGEIADQIGSLVYLEEYVTEMFSCDTDLIEKDNKTEIGITTLAGKTMKAEDSAFYGAEIEYILWGNKNPGTNVNINYGVIYMIRFALNAIYAFTDPEIQSYALEIATAIAGWTVVGVPIVQAIVTIVFALAESAIDICILKQGESVPIYKSKSTWKCSISGIANTAAQEVAKVLVKEAKKGALKLTDELFEKIEGEIEQEATEAAKTLSEELKKSAEQQINGIYTEVQNNIVTPFISQLAAVIDVDTEIDINSRVDDAFNKATDSVNSYINSLGDGMQKDIADAFWVYFSGNCLERFKGDVKNKLKDKESFTISGIIQGYVKESKDTIQSTIDDYITTATKKLKEGILDESGKLVDSAKGQVKSLISENMDSLSNSLGGSGSGSGSGQNGNANSSMSSKFNSLNYKEYCKILAFVQLSINQEKVLKRTGIIIQCNVRKKNNNDSFDISKAYTMVQISSDIRMNTLFPWAVSVDMNESNNEESMSPDIKNAKSDSVLIKYNAVNGY